MTKTITEITLATWQTWLKMLQVLNPIEKQQQIQSGLVHKQQLVFME